MVVWTGSVDGGEEWKEPANYRAHTGQHGIQPGPLHRTSLTVPDLSGSLAPASSSSFLSAQSIGPNNCELIGGKVQ